MLLRSHNRTFGGAGAASFAVLQTEQDALWIDHIDDDGQIVEKGNASKQREQGNTIADAEDDFHAACWAYLRAITPEGEAPAGGHLTVTLENWATVPVGPVE